MTTMIYCVKLQQQAEQLSQPPIPGELGKKIHTQISKPAWQEWVAYQTMLINEHRLNLLDFEARNFLLNEMDKFLFAAHNNKAFDI